MQVLYKFGTGVFSYLLVVAGSITLIVALLPVISEEAGTLAGAYLGNGPPKLSLIQQRRIDTALALPPLPDQGRMRVGPGESPPVSPAILASQLDFAERGDVEALYRIASYRVAAFTPDSQPSSIATRIMRVQVARRGAQYALTTRDIFNRSFGVITAASE